MTLRGGFARSSPIEECKSLRGISQSITATADLLGGNCASGLSSRFSSISAKGASAPAGPVKLLLLLTRLLARLASPLSTLDVPVDENGIFGDGERVNERDRECVRLEESCARPRVKASLAVSVIEEVV